MLALDVGNHVALRNLRATLGVNLNELAAEGCGHLNKLAPRSLYISKDVSLLVLLADERLNSRSAFALA